MSKVYDDPKYNAAFDRCVDVMALLDLGWRGCCRSTGLSYWGRCRRLRRMAVHSLRYQESNPFLCIRNLTKPLDIN